MLEFLSTAAAVTVLAVGSHFVSMRIIAYLDARHSRR